MSSISTMSSPRGTRALKSIEYYVKNKPNQFDSGVVLSKMQIISIKEGSLRGMFTVDQSMCNSLDTLHGGYISSVMDVAAVMGQLANDHNKIGTWSANMNINFLRSAAMGEKIIVETEPLRMGQYPIIQAILRSDQGVIAQGTVNLQTMTSDSLQKRIEEIFNCNASE